MFPIDRQRGFPYNDNILEQGGGDVRQLTFRLAWAFFACLLVVSMLFTAKPYLPTDAPVDHHAPVVTVPEPPADDEPELPDNPVDFAALQAEFPEAVAWIRVPSADGGKPVIDFKVMQSGEDTPEDFYLNHNEQGADSDHGAIYIQKYNFADFTDPNTIVYGHNIKGGKMFGVIHKFKDKEYFNEHEYLYVYTPGHVLTYRIYALFDYGERHLLWAYDFTTDEGRQKFINKTLKPGTYNRLVREGVTPTPANRLITLSTCQNTGNGRLLLVAMLVEDTETK